MNTNEVGTNWKQKKMVLNEKMHNSNFHSLVLVQSVTSENSNRQGAIETCLQSCCQYS